MSVGFDPPAAENVGTGFTRNDKGMVTGGPWPAKAGEATVAMEDALDFDGDGHEEA